MNIFNYVEFPHGIGLPKFSQNILTTSPKGNYSFRTKAKSLVGISTPFIYSAHSRQSILMTGFFMRTICTPLTASLEKLYQNYGGLVEGALARRFRVCGSTNLDQSITSRLVPLGDGYKKPYSEASIMLTTPTQKPFKLFTFAIGNRKRTHAQFKKIRSISTVARTEQHARNNLKGLRLTFVKCVPVQSQEVAA